MKTDKTDALHEIKCITWNAVEPCQWAWYQKLP